MQQQYQNLTNKQSGVALVVSLIMLTILTLIGLSSARISGLEVLMGVNTQDSVTSLMIAEDSVLAGEERIVTLFAGPPTFDLSADPDDGLYLDDNLDVNTVDWTPIASELEVRPDEPPRQFIVEYIGPRTIPGSGLGVGTGAVDNKRFMYRVSGLGGSNRGSARVVQTIYALQSL